MSDAYELKSRPFLWVWRLILGIGQEVFVIRWVDFNFPLIKIMESNLSMEERRR